MHPSGPTGPHFGLGASLHQLFKDDEGHFSMRGWAIMVIGGTALVFGVLTVLALVLQG